MHWGLGGLVHGEGLAQEDRMGRVWRVANQILVFKGYIEFRLNLDWLWCPRGFTLVYGIQL